MRVTIARKLVISFAVAVAVLLAVGLLSFHNSRALASATEDLNDGRRLARHIGLGAGLVRQAQLEAAAWVAGDTAGRETASASLERLMDIQYGLRVAARSQTDVQRVSAGFDSVARVLRQTLLDRRESQSATPLVERVMAAADSLEQRMDVILTSRGFHARATARSSELLLRVAFGVVLVLAPLALVIIRNELRERRAADEALAQSEARFRAATDGGLDAFYVLRALRDAAGEVLDFEFVDINRRAERLLGRQRREVIGQRLCELIPSNRVTGFFEKYVRVMTQGSVLEEEFEVNTVDVRAAWIHHQVVPLADGVAISSRDITERKQQEEALKALLLIDELTGLYNRRGFLTLAQQQLKLAKRGHRELLLLFVDMDDFKDINDTFGHNEGDVALTRAAAVLRKTFRDSDIIARLGGDEFVVLASDIAHGTSQVIIERLRHELHERNERDGYGYRLSFSVGLATFDPDRPPSIEELLATADSMLYEQKRQKNETLAGLTASV